MAGWKRNYRLSESGEDIRKNRQASVFKFSAGDACALAGAERAFS